MKIVAIQPYGDRIICIMDNGVGVPKDEIEGEVKIG